MLNDRLALELFSLHAFRRNKPPSDYLELTRRAVHYAQGLPLALTVLGSHLFGRSREKWEATLDNCRGEDPHREIRDILKISYDALRGDLQGYFLDIACFFKGELVDNVKPILEACYDLKSVIGIAQLQEKALIRIDEGWEGCRIWMHDLIEEMGKDIVHQESPEEPGKCSRVWSEEGVDDVLTNNTGTYKVIGIRVSWRSSTISLNAKSFSEMKRLRYISMSRRMKYESFSGDIDYLSHQLRWLDWPECPLQSFPSDFYANRLVEFNIPNSHTITQLWEGHKINSPFTLVLPGSEVPKWFHCSIVIGAAYKRSLSKTCTICFEIPSKLNWETIGLALCSVDETYSLYFNDPADISVNINGVLIHRCSRFTILTPDHMWLGYIPLSDEIKGKVDQKGWSRYHCRVEFYPVDLIKSCGVHLVCQPPNEYSNKIAMLP